MFFILGLKTRLSTIDTGMFRCPNEGGDRAYRHVRARRWFTLFFLPVIPLGTQGEWVRCQGCGTQYGPDVVDRYRAGQGA